MITSDFKCDKVINRRNAITKNAFEKRRKILANKQLNLNTKKRFLKCFVWSALLYGCESWTTNKAMQNKLEAMEMWCFRRISKMSWVKRVSSVDVLSRCNEERSLKRIIRQRLLKFIGHVIREESIKLYNELPSSLRQIDSFLIFKQNLKQFYMDN